MAKTWEDAIVEPEKRRVSWKQSNSFRCGLCVLGLWVLLRSYLTVTDDSPNWHSSSGIKSTAECHQVEPLTPSRSTTKLNDTESYLQSEDFRKLAIERLSGAVQIPTQSYDDMGDIGADPRWDIFNSFADYLVKTFPLTHATLQLDKVNTHGLL